jgi:hypothetical protein
MFHRRGGWLYYRKVVPPHLRTFFDKKSEVIVSLKTKDEKIGHARLLEVSLDTEKKLAHARELYKTMVASPEAMAAEWKYTALRGYEADRDRIVREQTPDAQLDDATLEAEVTALQCVKIGTD